jgi:hypothetical protein
MSTQARILTLAALCAAVLGAYWVLALAPKRADIAKVDAQIAQAESRRATAAASLATAGSARAAYQRDYATLARLGKAAPPDEDVASLLYQVEALARANKIDFRSLKLSEAVAPVAAEAPATATSSGDKAAGDKTADNESAAGAQASATPAAPGVAQAAPGSVVGSAGLVTLPFTFTFEGGYLRTQELLGALDRLADATGGRIVVNGRLLTVDGFSMAAGSAGFPQLKATVSATAYVVPPAADTLPGATAQPSAGTQPAAGAQPPATATASAPTRGVG